MTPEFSRIERAESIGDRARDIRIEANAAEREALAARFGLLAIHALRAELSLRREAAGIVARGHVRGDVDQACAVTDVAVPAHIDEPVALKFIEGAEGGDAPTEEIELAADDLDTIAISGGTIDLGEAAAETLALALDPFPRAPEAERALREAGVLTEEEARPKSPFAALGEQLKRP